MPSKQTANYALSQWVKSDQVRMEDFNADNAKLDAALLAAAQRSAGLDAKIAANATTAEQRSAGLDAKIAANATTAEQRSAGLDAKIAANATTAEQRSAGLDAKIDAAAATAEQRSAAVAAAAEQRAAGLEGRINTLSAVKGNCEIELFTYTGTGTGGQNGPTVITFRRPPLFFFVWGDSDFGTGTTLSGFVPTLSGGNVHQNPATWSGSTVSFYADYPAWQLNTQGRPYYVLALYALG